MSREKERSSSDQFAHLDRILFNESEIRERVRSMGQQIQTEYDGKPLSIVTILEGGALFMADLIREVHLPLRVGSVSVSSYGAGTTSSGTVTFEQTNMPDVSGSHVLIVDDILDSGRTLRAIVDRFQAECSPLSVRTAVLLSKRVERAVEISVDYQGFEVGDEFVVGYGLDYAGQYRNLPVIGVLKPQFYR